MNFNPRSPYGERHSYRTSFFWTAYFNPRSPYGERPMYRSRSEKSALFQSTLPLRGATYRVYSAYCDSAISIHAPLTGSDGMARSAR